MNEDELAPHISDAIKHVAPATSALRDEHIAAALAEISPVSSRSRTKWLSAAAAIVVLLIGGNALYASLGPSENTPTEIAMSEQTSSQPSATSKGSVCGADLTGYTIVGTYTSSGSVQEAWSSTKNLVVVDQPSCALLGSFTHPVAVANEKTCDGFFSTTDTQWVGAYSVTGARLTLIAATNELQIRDGSCAVIASYPLPTQP
jgi:hypothetical protein